MKQTYTGRELDVLYYFGDSNQPGFSISAFHLYYTASQFVNFRVNEDGELIVNSIYEPSTDVTNQVSINSEGYLVVNGVTSGLVEESEDGYTSINTSAVKNALSGNFYNLYSKNVLSVGIGYSVDLLTVVSESDYIPTGDTYSSLYKYPDCIEGISLIFKDRLDWIEATISVIIDGAGTFSLKRKWKHTKTIGALFEEIEVGLSQVRRNRIKSVTITIDDMSVDSAELVSLYPGLVLTFNNERHLKNLNIHQDMPNDNGVLSGGLCLSSGSIEIDDSEKYLLRLLVKYEYRGIMGTRGRYFNNFFENEKGELIFEEGYYPEPFPLFQVRDGDIELTSSLMSDFITYKDGNIYADYEGAPDNLINKKKHLVEVYLEGHKPLYKLQVTEFSYNNTQYTAMVSLEDILNRLDDIKIDKLESNTDSSNYLIYMSRIMDALTNKIAHQGFYIGPILECYNPSNSNLEFNYIYYRLPRSTAITFATEMSAKSILEGFAASLGLVVYLRPYFDEGRKTQVSSSSSLTRSSPYCADYFLMIRPYLEDIGQIKQLSMYGYGMYYPTRYQYEKEAYVMIDSAIIGSITRSVIKPNYISKVIGSYIGWNSQEQTFDQSLQINYEIGSENNAFIVKDNTYIYYDDQNNYGTVIKGSSEYTYQPFYKYLANNIIEKYLFGLDTVEFDAILSKNYGNDSYVCPIVFNIGERFTLDFSRTEIPTNYQYQIISTTLNYDGELTFSILGMQC